MTLAKPRSRAADLNRLVLEQLEDFVLRHSNMHQISIKVGTDRHFLSRRLACDRRTTITELFQAVEAMELPADSFLRAVLFHLPELPSITFLKKAGVTQIDESTFEIPTGENAKKLQSVAHLLMDQGLFGEALAVLERAFSAFALVGEGRGLANTLLTRGRLYRLMGRSRPALQAFLDAERLRAELDLESQRILETGLAWSFKEQAQVAEAEERLARARELASPESQAEAAELLWIEAGIARLLVRTRSGQAIQAYEACATSYEALNKPYETLFVLLELAQVLAITRRTGALEKVVSRATTILRTLKFDPKSEDSVLAFLRGVLHGSAEPDLARRAVRALRIAGLRGPHKRPRPPGRPKRPKPPGAPRSKRQRPPRGEEA